jgi:hypothetical protein
VNETTLREQLREGIAVSERQSEERAWAVARAAYERRTVGVRHPRLRPRLALALAGTIVLLVALSLTPAGAEVRDWIADVIEPGAKNPEPALTSLPTRGRLLVESAQGTWTVQEDGSKRLLGSYHEATWSPNGVFAAVTRGRHLTAVVADPNETGQVPGTVRWSLAQARPIHHPAWAPSGIRLAYLAGGSLHLVAGNGTGDRILEPSMAGSAPAWRPGTSQNVLAVADAENRVIALDVESGQPLWRSAPAAGPIRRLEWSADGGKVLALTPDSGVVLKREGRMRTQLPTGVAAASFAPAGDRIALIRESHAGRSRIVVTHPGEGHGRTVFSARGRFTDLVWSPDGEWLLLSWREADQWIFVRPSDGRIEAVDDISAEFNPGASSPSAFPRVSGWCCVR